MAVYTHVPAAELERLLARYPIGSLKRYSAVAEGVENTNYVVETDAGRFILTLFEKRVRRDDLPFFLALTAHLAAHGTPAPMPIAAADGAVIHDVCGRPAAIVTFLGGAVRMTPTPGDCAAVGRALGALHEAGRDFPMRRDNDLGLAGWRRLEMGVYADADRCAPGLAALIRDELAVLDARWPIGLPEGVIHADLFPDNVFFDGAAVTGVFDFYFACTDALAYDLAVTVNAWASRVGSFDEENATAILAGYEAVRTLTAAERGALPILLRGAALRFLLTRLHDSLHQVPGAVVRVKDPLEYRDLLIRHRERGGL